MRNEIFFCQWLDNFNFGCDFRTKIQAQRKFAQGQQPPSSAYLSYLSTSSNQELSEVAAKEKSPEKDVLPVRPSTEDFLTFLCFRGTNALPRELDFDNSTYNQPSTSANSKAASPQKKSEASKDDKKKNNTNKKSLEKIEKIDPKSTTKKNEELSSPSPQKEIDPKTGFIPFAVRKRAEIVPTKVEKKNVATKSPIKTLVEPEKPPKSAPNSKKSEKSEKTTPSNVKEKRLTRNSTVNLPTSTPKNTDSQSDDEPLLVKSEPKPKKTKTEVENSTLR